MLNEERALVLDYMAKGKSDSFKSEPLVQLLGEQFFTLLEAIPKGELRALESVYVGKEQRDKIDHIKRRISSGELTSTASAELEKAIEKIVLQDKQRFLQFFNSAGPISLRRHQLELLPGFGKKHMLDLLNERQKKPFESFDDLIARVRLMPDPIKAVVKRIEMELQDEELNHYLFARPPAHEQKFGRR